MFSSQIIQNSFEKSVELFCDLKPMVTIVFIWICRFSFDWLLYAKEVDNNDDDDRNAQ